MMATVAKLRAAEWNQVYLDVMQHFYFDVVLVILAGIATVIQDLGSA
jgi:hypothetical protein